MSDHDDDELLLGGGGGATTAPAVAPQPDDAPVEADADALAAALDSDDDGSGSGSSSDGDDDDQPQGGGNDAGEGGAATTEGAEAAAGGDEADPSAITSKKEAKRLLSKKQYKKWKKKHAKKSKKDKKSGKKDKKKDTKKDKKKAEKSSSKKKSKKSRGGDDDSSDDGQGGDSDSDDGRKAGKRKTRGAPRATTKKAAADVAGDYDFTTGMSAAMLEAKAKKQSAATKFKYLKDDCARIVERMAAARKADALAISTGTAPLNRLQLIPLVRAAGNRLDMHEHLVAYGFLKEMGNWLCTGRTLAPIDLRNTALYALGQMKMEHAEGGKLAKSKVSKKGDDDLIGYEGITKEQLKDSNLGYAANFLRQHPSETTDNRALASYLLQRMSRAFAGEEPEVDASSVKRWSAQGDSTVLPPFEALKSSSEIFVAKNLKVDPLDPTSYMRIPPHRGTKTYISGVFKYADNRPPRGAPEETDE